MTPEPLPLFLNPAAGRGRAGKYAAAMKALFEARGVAIALIVSNNPGDLEQQILAYSQKTAGPVLLAGGDGSVYEAVNGILNAGGRSALGVVPIGTGNDFAKACGIPLDWQTAVHLLADRIAESVPVRRIDAGRMNERYFANVAGIGFDARVNLIARKYRWPIGDFVYLIAVIEALYDEVATPSVVLQYGEHRYEGRMTLASISNGPWVGGLFHIAPAAKNDDGLFDLVFASPVTRRRILALLPKLIRGTHLGEIDIESATVSSFALTADAPLPSHLDGEVQPMQCAFRMSILPDALSIL